LITSCYQIMDILSHSSMRASTIGATATGIILSVWTHYGLLKYRWIIVKEILTLLLIWMNLWGMPTWTRRVLENIEMGGLEDQTTLVNLNIWIGIMLQVSMLIFIFVISRHKPWGKRKNDNKRSR